MFEPLCPPADPLRPCGDDDCEPPGLGIAEPERPPPPEDGMLEPPPPPPEDEDDPPLLPPPPEEPDGIDDD